MVVSCWCGCVYGGDGEIEQCPYCGEPAVLPRVTDEDADLLRADLDLMLKYPILAEEAS